MRKALVTGGSGFIGSRLAEQLSKNGYDLRLILRGSSSLKNLENVKFERFNADLRDQKSLQTALDGIDVVFHLAGTLASKNTKDFFDGNQLSTKNLAEVAKKQNRKIRFVYVSSLAAGGPVTSYHLRTEADPDQPVSDYGRSKKAAEEVLSGFQDSLDIRIIRPPIVYGPRDPGVFEIVKMANSFVCPILKGSNADKKKYYSHIFVDDLVSGIIGAASYDKQGAQPDIFYLTNPEVLSFEKMITQMSIALEKRPIKLFIPSWGLSIAKAATKLLGGALGGKLNSDKFNEIQPDYWICSSDKASKTFGFSCQTSFQEGIQQAVNWYRANHWI